MCLLNILKELKGRIISNSDYGKGIEAVEEELIPLVEKANVMDPNKFSSTVESTTEQERLISESISENSKLEGLLLEKGN